MRLQRQPTQVLLLLVKRAGEIVTREEIQQTIWTDDIVINFEVGLNRCIGQIRAVLLDDADVPRFIETIPRVGYRFIAPVTIAAPVPKAPPSPPSPVLLASSEVPASTPKPRWRIWTLVGCLAILGIAGYFVTHSGDQKIASDLILSPLITELGFSVSPTFSPDGTQVAFSWNGPVQNNFDIYVKVVGSRGALRLTDTPEIEYSPTWSPDGRIIAFCRGAENGRASIWTMPPLGGTAQKIIDLSWLAAFDARVLAWSHDSSRIVYPDRVPRGTTNALFAVDIKSGSIHQITFPSGSDTDMDPAYSPDGHSLAFVRDVGRGISRIYVLPLRSDGTSAGEPKLLSWPDFDNVYLGRPLWTSDNRSIIFASNKTGEQQLWLGDTNGSSAPQLLPIAPAVVDAALSATGKLAVVRELHDTDIWRLNLDLIGREETVLPEHSANSTRLEANPQISPDGSRIAFESNRSGFSEIWTSNVDGSHPVELTETKHPGTGSPAWSHDGARIAFDSRIDGVPRIYWIPSQGGRPSVLTASGERSVVPNWSADDKWIFFTSDHDAQAQIWRIPAQGGTAEQVTRNGGFAPVASPDSEFLYYTANRSRLTELRSLHFKTNTETTIASNVARRSYSPVAGRIYYVSGTSEGARILHVLDRASGADRPLYNFRKPIADGIAVSSDGKYLYFTQIERGGSDLQLVENFGVSK